MATERIIGIDFGTSTSVIRTKRYNGNQPVDDRLHTDKVVFDSRTTVPTLIKRSAKGRYYGYDAEKLGRGDEQFKGFKVNLESEIPPLREQARELTKEFFRYLYDVYSSQSEGGHLGDPDDRERTIVSYPVKWSEETREFMLQAARDAKFKNVEGMDEAQAAIHAVTVQNESQLTQKGYLPSGRATNILLIDMGAGTTDLVLCKYTPGSAPDIVCTWPVGGEVLFGGQEMEKILRSYIGCYLDKDDPMSERLLNNLGELAFKSWKEKTVSKSLLHHETVEEFTELDNMADMAGVEVSPFSLDRTEMETIAKNYLSQFAQLVNGCLNEASKKGIRRGDIDLVILTGGHSQWYFVKDMLLDKQLIDLPKIREDRGRILDTALPQETVALGMVFSPMAKYDEKFVQMFSEGSKEMTALLGVKGANLSEMTHIGLPVPDGFVITTKACKHFFHNDYKLPDGLGEQIAQCINKIQESTGKYFNDINNPLLLSVRLSNCGPMAGAMEPILNIGLNDEIVSAVARKSPDPRWIYDCYRRLIRMYATNAMDVDAKCFDRLIDKMMADRGVTQDTELNAGDLRKLAGQFKAEFKSQTGVEFPSNPMQQLIYAVMAAFYHWDNPRSNAYRKDYHIPFDQGCAAIVQSMVYGNIDNNCCVGVVFTRHPATGEKGLFGEYLPNSQGMEEVLSGVRTPMDISELEQKFPEAFAQFAQSCRTLEKHFKDMMDIEFVVERGKFYILDTRPGKRTAEAARKIASDFVDEGIISRGEADRMCSPDNPLIVTAPPNTDDVPYKKIVLIKKPVNVTEEMITEYIEKIRSEKAVWKSVGYRPAKNGDQVTIDFSGSIGGQPVEGTSAANYSLVLGSGVFVPGFEDQIEDHRKGECFTVYIRFPDDYQIKATAGKNVDFRVVLKDIKERELPVLNDRFAASVSGTPTLAGWREKIRRELSKKLADETEKDLENQLCDRLIELLTVNAAQAAYENEVENMIRELDNRLRGEGMDMEIYCKYTDMTLDDIREMYRPEAERRVRLRMALELIAEKENIFVTNAELEKAYQKHAEDYNMSVHKVKKIIPADSLTEDIKVQKAMELVKSTTVIKDC